MTGGAFAMNSLTITCNTGQTPYLIGDYAEPSIEMRYSSDYAQTWEAWEAETLGAQGNYRAMPSWRALGMADVPGVLFELRVTDPVPVRFSGFHLNEPMGGRAR